MKRQFRDWDTLYAQYKQTNLSVAAFAEKRKIPLSVAYKQFHKRAIKEDEKTDDEDVSFIPVTIAPVKETTTPSEERLINKHPDELSKITVKAGKFTLHIPAGFDENSLTSILKVIGGLC